ncbi:CLUMA_CG004951, isoform A [Clunio marinus]|uniref:CLUMA_CG004951, isoform A n=1 Tax=Clunio marinus TaxID=568069 RepID=A0A1J1HT84_9DIPT|nr:CLUMA_CG004951, isoform A [Clunio marinus]
MNNTKSKVAPYSLLEVMLQINSNVGYKGFEWLNENTSTNRKLFGLSTSKFIQALSDVKVMLQINSDVGYKDFEWLNGNTSTNRNSLDYVHQNSFKLYRERLNRQTIFSTN